MKLNFLTPLIVVILTFGGMTQKAEAQSIFCPNCWYIAGYGGPAWLREMDVTFKDPAGMDLPQPIITDYRTGYTFGGSIGAVFCQNWRLEIEGSFRNFTGKRVVATLDDSVACTGPCGCDPGLASIDSTYNPSSRFQAVSLMFNGFYDFCLCPAVSWYIGGGIGPSWIEYRLRPLGDVFSFQGAIKKVEFSYQFITGIAYQLCDNYCNTVSLTLAYRLWGTTKNARGSGSYVDIGGSFNNTSRLMWDDVLEPRNVEIRRIPLVHSIELGLRVGF